MELPEAIRGILTRLTDAGYDAYAVGGCVRDMLRGVTPHDWDICTAARPEETHAVFAGFDVRDTGLKHGTVTLVLDHTPYEITTFRIDGAYSDARRPDSVRFTDSVREDLARRDFTINAMAYSSRSGLVDPFGGSEDLRRGLIRCVGDPAARFSEDALRILRALRFSSALGFPVEPETDRALRALAGSLTRIAPERIKNELERMLTGRDAVRVLLDYPDVIGVVIPELLPCVGFDQLNPYHIYDIWEHTARSVGFIDPEPPLRWTMLLHDLGKPVCFSKEGRGTLGHFYGHGRVSAQLADGIMDRLRFSCEERSIIRGLVNDHDRFIKPEPKAVRRELGRIGAEQFFRADRVRRADVLAQNPAFAEPRLTELALLRTLAEDIIAARECVSLKTLAVNGDDLISIGCAPGPALGAELNRLLDAVLDAPEKNDRDTLLTLAAEDLADKA